MRLISFVIPALNEAENIPSVLAALPLQTLAQEKWETEIIVVDNNSIDGTGEVASRLGARVVHQPKRGYGNAYQMGFREARGSVIITGDADCSYPFDHATALLGVLMSRKLDFLNTNRLGGGNRAAMKVSHRFANRALSAVSRAAVGSPFQDSQSGMWVFRRHVWKHLDVRSEGMAFSQEIKNEAFLKGFTCGEVPIEYRLRGGEVKLNAVSDGMRNLTQLLAHVRRSSPLLQPEAPTSAAESQLTPAQ